MSDNITIEKCFNTPGELENEFLPSENASCPMRDAMTKNRNEDLFGNDDLRKISSGDFTGVGETVKEMFSAMSIDSVPNANKIVGAFERVVQENWIEALGDLCLRLAGLPQETLAKRIVNAHKADISERIVRMEHDAIVLAQANDNNAYELKQRIAELEREVFTARNLANMAAGNLNEWKAKCAELEAQLREAQTKLAGRDGISQNGRRGK